MVQQDEVVAVLKKTIAGSDVSITEYTSRNGNGTHCFDFTILEKSIPAVNNSVQNANKEFRRI